MYVILDKHRDILKQIPKISFVPCAIPWPTVYRYFEYDIFIV